MERGRLRVLTFEEMLLQADPGHELVDEQPVLVLVAVADQLHQVRVPQLPQEEHFRLHACMVLTYINHGSVSLTTVNISHYITLLLCFIT